MLKKGDVFVAAVLIALAGILFLAGINRRQGDTVVIMQEGRIIYEGSLAQDYEITLKGDYENRIVVREGSIWYEESDCPGKDCVRAGRISRGGQSAACLPNRTSIVVMSTKGGVDVVAK